MATKYLALLATVLLSAANAHALPGVMNAGQSSSRSTAVATTALAASTAATTLSPSTSNLLAVNAPVTTYNSEQIMSVYSSLTSSVNNDVASVMSAAASSAVNKCNEYWWYANYYVSVSDGSTATGNGLVASQTSSGLLASPTSIA